MYVFEEWQNVACTYTYIYLKDDRVLHVST